MITITTKAEEKIRERPVVGRHRSGSCGQYAGGRLCDEESPSEDDLWLRQLVQRLTHRPRISGGSHAHLA
jgi:hypothetical protein